MSNERESSWPSFVESARRTAAETLAHRPTIQADVDAVDVDEQRLKLLADQVLHAAWQASDLVHDDALPTAVLVDRAAWADQTAVDYGATLASAWERGLAVAGDEGPVPGETNLVRWVDRFPGGIQGVWGAVLGMICAQNAERAIGEFELPVPRPRRPTLMVVPSNLARFSTYLGLGFDEAVRWAMWHDGVRYAIAMQSAVASWTARLIARYPSMYRWDPAALQRFLPIDLHQGEETVNGMFDILVTNEQRYIGARLRMLNALATAYASHLAVQDEGRSFGVTPRISAAISSRNMALPVELWLSERLLGLRCDAMDYTSADAFVAAIAQDKGADWFRMLWISRDSFPKVHEFDHPDIWLERVSRSAS